jgi:hypothetical protein
MSLSPWNCSARYGTIAITATRGTSTLRWVLSYLLAKKSDWEWSLFSLA